MEIAMKTQDFGSVHEVLASLDPSYPVFCLWPDVLADRARQFLEGFPGTVLYAVKCNPHPIVLRSLYAAGIRHFDTASLPEIAQVRELFEDANCYFNHPVKGRGQLDSARKVYGIDHYVVDHLNELEKLLDVVGPDITVQVRVSTPNEFSPYDFSSKFGAPRDEAVELLKTAENEGCKTAVSFHVGSQCDRPEAFATALEAVGEAVDEAGVAPEYVNVGGGFPADYTGNLPPLKSFFEAIGEAFEKLQLPENTGLFCEPGRALVADAGSLLAQVHLRKDQALYINEGLYGYMSEIRDGMLEPPVRAIGKGRQLAEKLEPFRIFGPTCDPLDVMKVPFRVPADIEEGDWIEVQKLGAYSNAVASGFNGLSTDAVVCVRGTPDHEH